MNCWNCKAIMTKKEDENHHPYYLCPECGATHTEIPEPGFSPLADHGFYHQSPEGNRLTRSYRPSKSSKRDARKARSTV